MEPTQAGFYVNPIRSEGLGGAVGTLTYSSGEVVFNTTKPFVIQHPLHQEQYLVHACLEGPEPGVFYRGTAVILPLDISCTVCLPAYATVVAQGFTVEVTRVLRPEEEMGAIGGYGATRVSAGGAFSVYGPPGEYDWMVRGSRGDIATEVPKSAATLCGEGPYRYLVPVM